MSNEPITPPARPMPRNLRLPGQMPTNIRPLTGKYRQPATGPKPKRRSRPPPPPAHLTPVAAGIWNSFAKTLWRREDWHPEFLLGFADHCVLETRCQGDQNLSAALVAQLRLSRAEWGLTLRTRRARMIERDGT